MGEPMVERAPHPFTFFEQLVWLDGRPLMSTIEPYRREVFERALLNSSLMADRR